MDILVETSFGVFEWNEDKCNENFRKHKLDFLDAICVFQDEYAFVRHDQVHSTLEDRFKIVGIIHGITVIAVFFTDREHNITRIISARRATQKEVKEYDKARTRWPH